MPPALWVPQEKYSGPTPPCSVKNTTCYTGLTYFPGNAIGSDWHPDAEPAIFCYNRGQPNPVCGFLGDKYDPSRSASGNVVHVVSVSRQKPFDSFFHTAPDCAAACDAASAEALTIRAATPFFRRHQQNGTLSKR